MRALFLSGEANRTLTFSLFSGQVGTSDETGFLEGSHIELLEARQLNKKRLQSRLPNSRGRFTSQMQKEATI